MITIQIHEDEYHFIRDCINDRRENLADLNTGDFGMEGDFDDDIAMADNLHDKVFPFSYKYHNDHWTS